MKLNPVFTLLFAFILSIKTVDAQSIPTWDGDFEGTIVGISSILTGESDADSWIAVIDAGGYLFDLQCTLENTVCAGTMTDPQTQVSIPFKAILENDRITLSITDVNPLTGLQEQMDFVFLKSTGTETSKAVTPPSNTTMNTGSKNLDAALVGSWRRTESYVSGEFSFATDWHMLINADGTYQYGEGRTMGGGPSSSIDSGTGKTESGNWKTENQILFVHDGNQWQQYARYYQENGNLMFTFANGKKQIWERIN